MREPWGAGQNQQFEFRDTRRVLSGNLFINRGGLRRCDAPKEYGPHKALYNCCKRWSAMGVFARIMMGLATETPDNETISIAATYPQHGSFLGNHERVKGHRTASSLRRRRRGWTPDLAGQGRCAYEFACRNRRDWAAYLIHH